MTTTDPAAVVSAGVHSAAPIYVLSSRNVAGEVRVALDPNHPIPYWHSHGQLTAAHRLNNSFYDGGPAPIPTALSVSEIERTLRIPMIRFDTRHDPVLGPFVKRMQTECATIQDDLGRVRLIASAVSDVFGGVVSTDPVAAADFERSTNAIIDSIVNRFQLPVIYIGQLMVARKGICRHRALLLKFVVDHSVLHAAEWGHRPISPGIRILTDRPLSPPPAGAHTHVWSMVVMTDGTNYKLNLEHSPEKFDLITHPPPLPTLQPPFKSFIPSSASISAGADAALALAKHFSQSFENLFPNMKEPLNNAHKTESHFSMELLNKVTQALTIPDRSAATAMDVDSGAGRSLTVDELARKFATERIISYHEFLCDGFKWDASIGFPISSSSSSSSSLSASSSSPSTVPREVLVLDASTDPELAQCIVLARNLLKMYSGAEKRAVLLAKFVAMKFGGSAPDIHSRAETLIARIRHDTRSDVLPIGQMLGKAGSHRHRALLYKYLADITARHSALWSPAPTAPGANNNRMPSGGPTTLVAAGEPICCLIEATNTRAQIACAVMIEEKQYYIDLCAETIKLSNDMRQEKRKDGQISAVAAAAAAVGLDLLRFNYDELSDLSPLRPGYCHAKFRGRLVTLVTSIPGRPYDTARFNAEMEAWSSAKHTHVSQLLGISLSNDCKLPKLMAVYEYLHGPTLSETLTKSTSDAKSKPNAAIPIEQRIRVCIQIGQGLSHLHSLGLVHGQLNSANIRLDERSGDIKLAAFELVRYALPFTITPDSTASEADASSDTIALAHARYWAPERFEQYENARATQPPQSSPPASLQMLNGGLAAGQAADIWAFGAILYAVLLHAEPWANRQFAEIRAEILSGRRPASDATPAPESAVPVDLLRLIDVCMSPAPRDRPTIDECIERLRATTDLKKLVDMTTVLGWTPGVKPEFKFESLDPSQTATAVPSNNTSTPAVVGPPAPGATAASAAAASTSAEALAQAARTEADLKLGAKIAAVEESLQPLNPWFGDGPSVEQCDAAREAALERLGEIDKKMLVGEHVATCALYIIHRSGPSNGNVALVTRGLSDPPNELPNTTGLGLELIAEAKESEVGHDLGGSFLFQMMHEVAGNSRQFGVRLRQLIDLHGLVSMELNNVEAPPQYIDPATNRSCVLLGLQSPTVPDSFFMPGGLRVRLITVRLLTFDECVIIRRFGASGRRAIAELFARDGTYHVSTARALPQNVPNPLSLFSREAEVRANAAAPVPIRSGGATQTLPMAGDAAERYAARSPFTSDAPANSNTAGTTDPMASVANSFNASDRHSGEKRNGDGLDDREDPAKRARTSVASGPASSPATDPAPDGSAHDPKWDLDAVRRRIAELQLQPHQQPYPAYTGQPTGATMATAAIQPAVPPAQPTPTQSGGGGGGGGALLPALDEKQYEAPITTQSVFPRFARRTQLSDALAQFDARVRVLMNTLNPAQGLAKHISNSLATQTQLAGWQHVQEYVVDPKGYQDKLRAVRGETIGIAKTGPPRAIDQLQLNGQRLMKRLMQRVDWVLQLLSRNGQEFDADFCIQVVAADTRWMDDTSSFMKDSELKVTELLRRNPQRFAAFRDLQKRGVQWPHTPQLRKEIEAAGFVFRPMMVKRDRCVCETCGAEVAGWRPWHNPWLMHNMARHDAIFQEKAQRLGSVYAQCLKQPNTNPNQTPPAAATANNSSSPSSPPSSESKTETSSSYRGGGGGGGLSGSSSSSTVAVTQPLLYTAPTQAMQPTDLKGPGPSATTAGLSAAAGSAGTAGSVATVGPAAAIDGSVFAAAIAGSVSTQALGQTTGSDQKQPGQKQSARGPALIVPAPPPEGLRPLRFEYRSSAMPPPPPAKPPAVQQPHQPPNKTH